MNTQHLRRLSILAILATAGLAGSGCSTMNNTERGAVGGGVVGTAAGTAIGALTGKPLLGAAVGGLGGTAAGALIGNQADKEENRQRDAVQTAALADAQAQSQRIGIADVIRLSREGMDPQVIINQIRTTRSTFQLTVSDLEMLKNSGVSDAVIAEMQNSPPGRTYVRSPRPTTVIYESPPPPVIVEPYYAPRPPVYVVGGYYRRW